MHLLNRLQRLAIRGFAALPEGVHRALAGAPITREGKALDPQVQAVLRLFGDPPGKVETVAQTRAGFDAQGDWLAHPPRRDVTTTALSLPGPHGPIPCEAHRSPDCPAQDAPALLFYHGGGHVGGSLCSHRPPARELAAQLGAVVITVAHRLAPEHRFPVGIEDCIAAYRSAVQQAEALGIDPARISVGGDSAGGNAAAVVAQACRAEAHPPRFQILWSPWLDMSQQHPSYALFAEGFFLERAKMEWYTDHYLRHADDGQNPLASPLLGDLSGLCPAAVIVAGFDPLRDEGVAYAKAMQAAGGQAELHVLDGMVHPWINLAGSIRGARAGFDLSVRLLRAAM